jgi:HlyD family secretion protein
MTSDNTSNGNQVTSRGRPSFKLIGVAVLLVAVGAAVTWFKVVRAEEDPTAGMATFVAKRGDLTISVLESGAIKAKEQEVIRNEVEGRTTIISIVPEGTNVKKGDLLIELDASTLEDERIDQEIQVQNAEAAFIDANESLAIAENQAKSDIELAELNLKFARQDLLQYQDGQYPNLEIAAINKVEEANEVLTRAIQTRQWSETLYTEKYLSETELLADRLAETRARNSLIVAQNDLKLLKEYTRQREIDQLVSDVNQAEMAMERTQRKASANVVQAKANLNAREQEWKRQVDKLDKLKDQIDKAMVYSPADGMVVYATSSRGGFGRDDRRPLADGVEVTERQELIYIPKSASSVAEVDVHEASLDKVRPGFPAIVRVDALPGKTFLGTVSRIAPLPNAQSMWMNPDLKVYTTNIDLQATGETLRNGMSCKAEIIVEQYKDVVYIPVQSVIRVNGQPTVYVVNDGQIEERKVEISLDNNSMVMVSSGLNEGEVVLLTPPLKAATLEPGARLPGAGDANDTTAQQIREQLQAANEMQAEALPTSMGDADGSPGRGQDRNMGPDGGFDRQGGQGFRMPSSDQIEEMRKRLEGMSPEERQREIERMRQRFQGGATTEERGQTRSGRGQGGGPGGGRNRADPGAGPRGGQ